MLAQIASWNTAQQLIEAGLRLSIVHSLTGLSTTSLRQLWRDIHNEMPRKGKLPVTCMAYMRNRGDAAALSAYVGVHMMMFGEPTSSPHDLLASWRAHQSVMRGQEIRLDINAAYFALQDVRCKTVNFIWCSGCGGQYIHDHGSHLTDRCPHCHTSPLS